MNSQGADNPSLVTTSLLTVAIISPLLATLAVALRIWSTHQRVKRLFRDDYMIVLNMICAWGVPIDVYVAAGRGGINHSTPPLEAVHIFLEALWVEVFLLLASLVLVRVSILLFYRRIFVTRWFKFAVWVYVATLVTLQCQLLAGDPILAILDPLAVNALRYNYNNFSIAFTAMSMCFDVVVLCYPLPMIHSLMISTRRKLELVGIFWLGIFCCIASILRFYYVYTEVCASTSSNGANRYASVTAGVTWGTIEPSTGVIAACLPTYGHFFRGGQGLSTTLGSFWSRLSRRHATREAGRKSSGKQTSTVIRSTNTSKPANSRHHWQWLGSGTSGDGDIEMADADREENVPLTKDVKSMRIHISQSFTQMERTASFSEFPNDGTKPGQQNILSLC
ncbi:hypothetical protein DPV78_003381 [Talaromyces pinophilus]|nr:hypothetical protein DPV78_003381 [Talaromyces pinophilus]